MNDLIPVFKVDGQALSNGENIYSLDFEVVDIRQRVGMVFQRPNPFPMSIYDNIAYGSRLYGIRKRQILDEIVEQSLRQIAIWEDVRDKVNQSALDLSGGQQQRLRAP